MRPIAPMYVALLVMLPAAAAAQRTVHHVVESNARPCMRVAVDPELTYLGRVEGPVMGGRARAERFVFGALQAGALGRTVIVHFEAMEPDSAGAFTYPGFRLDTIAGEEYLQQVWPAPQLPLFATEPIAGLLRDRGISAEPDWILHRWARGLGEDKRSEVLLFYLEPVSTLGTTAEELGADWDPRGIAGPTHVALEAALMQRARDAIHVEPASCGRPADRSHRSRP